MKKIILSLVLLLPAIIKPSFSAEEKSFVSYKLAEHPTAMPQVITLPVGECLTVKGDKLKMTVGGDELSNAPLIDSAYWDGTNVVMYLGGAGGKEGTKIIYNYSLWHFDNNSLKLKNSPFTCDPNYFEDTLGIWRFKAVATTPVDQPYELRFLNKDGETAILEVNVL